MVCQYYIFKQIKEPILKVLYLDKLHLARNFSLFCCCVSDNEKSLITLTSPVKVIELFFLASLKLSSLKFSVSILQLPERLQRTYIWQIGSNILCKYQSSLKRLVTDEYFSLFCRSISDEVKTKFFNIETRHFTITTKNCSSGKSNYFLNNECSPISILTTDGAVFQLLMVLTSVSFELRL